MNARIPPSKQGMYDPQFEHDACGIAMMANVDGTQTHDLVKKALIALERLDHRGGNSAKETLGDGSGILTQIPHPLFQSELEKTGIQLPEPGMYGVGMFFLPANHFLREKCETAIHKITKESGLEILAWREVPVVDNHLHSLAKETQPTVKQLFVQSPSDQPFSLEFERTLYQIRRKLERELHQALFEEKEPFYAVSFSARTIVYKGLLLPRQLSSYYQDLTHHLYQSAMAMVHNRFSTNTFPSWQRAQPNRFLMHNGEINTINGNMNWMHARESLFATDTMGDINELLPVIDPTGSDSAMFDNVLEFLVMAGWDLPRAMMMMVPEAWEKNEQMHEDKKSFYAYHRMLMEPWDGPAALAYTDGIRIGASLDRNGLRPARIIETEDGFICVASETGVVDLPEESIIRKDRLKPGQMLVIDLEKNEVFFDEEIKQRVIEAKPYDQLVKEKVTLLDSLPDLGKADESLIDAEKQQAIFSYTNEEIEKIIKPMVLDGKEPVASMGYDAPLAILSKEPQLLFNYFKQRFAQVTNPPIDAIREESVTSLEVMIGPDSNLLDPKEEIRGKILLRSPILSRAEMRKIEQLNRSEWHPVRIPSLFPAGGKLETAMDDLCQRVDEEIDRGSKILILSDRDVGEEAAAIPSLLAVSRVHHYLIQTGRRSEVSLIIESGEPREVHHFAALLGYGANAIYPYLIYASIPKILAAEYDELLMEEGEKQFIQAAAKGILKVMSKMGISTVRSYIGAQIFEALGISLPVIDRYFPRTPSRLGGLTIEDIGKEVMLRHQKAFCTPHFKKATGSDLQWRHGEEAHLFQPRTIHLLQHAVRTGEREIYKKYSKLLHEEVSQQTTIRGLLDFKYSRKAIPIEEVESADAIMKRFKTGAMSYGSISKESHEAIAIAMNRIGGKSNSGEGGEDPARFVPMRNKDSKLSRIKQVASGRFGVTSHYLIHSDEIQIKMAQGAKPGEGGQLAGHKVTEEVAKTRGATPGIELISPPPHHDIYSIEDLAQLIYDLKNVNRKASINVKLVSGAGVGTIAAGVAKAKADVILISGYDGGTGAAARSSIKHAGMPWELGLAETHQTLTLNGLRENVTLETDGKMMSGRDVIIAALLGAETFGFSTLPLISLGCIMMRVCHLDTCPVGIATQNKELRKNMLGKPEHIVNMMQFFAEEIREYLAALGFRKLDEVIGRADLLRIKKSEDWKAQKLDLSPLLFQPGSSALSKKKQQFNLNKTLDYQKLLPLFQKLELKKKQPWHRTLPIQNTDRTVGALLGHSVTSIYGENGMEKGQFRIDFQGAAGQSFGGFLPKGVHFTLEGEANDYVGKGLSGGTLVLYPPRRSKIKAEENIIIGNASFYGATSGAAYIRGKSGERFCVRNSGAHVVAEGVGDHGCEYMTGGSAIILGETGKNFAAGMSGGVAYVYTASAEAFKKQCNQELVTLETVDELEDREFVKKQITKHYNYTNSKRAEEILANWDAAVKQLVKIIPTEYKRILEAEKEKHAVQPS